MVERSSTVPEEGEQAFPKGIALQTFAPSDKPFLVRCDEADRGISVVTACLMLATVFLGDNPYGFERMAEDEARRFRERSDAVAVDHDTGAR